MISSQTNNRGATRHELPLTADAHRALSAELDRLRAERADHTRRLRAALQFGDGSNNDERLAIREDEAITEARIARLETILARAVIVEAAASGDSAAIGSAVTLRDHASGRTSTYLIDGAHGSLEPHVVSALSPMGVALLGQRPGALVEVELPGGRLRGYDLLAVSQDAPT